MNERDRFRLLDETFKDEQQMNRGEYDYASDIIVANSASPHSIWVEPNSTVKGIIEGTVDYNTVPYDELNETQKGIFFTEQGRFVGEHEGEEILCEALSLNPCLQEECPLFIPAESEGNNHGQPLCREYKVVFRKN